MFLAAQMWSPFCARFSIVYEIMAAPEATASAANATFQCCDSLFSNTSSVGSAQTSVNVTSICQTNLLLHDQLLRNT